MVFSSAIFLFVFFPIFLLFYFLAPGIVLRNAVAVVFSVFFFAWGDPFFVGVVIAGTILDHLVIKYVLVQPTVSRPVKIWALVLTIGLNVAALAFFKYANFAIDQLQWLLGPAQFTKPSWYGVALPLGISFIVFHKISFLVDIYKNRNDPPRSLLESLLYIMFFPQLVAGPIVRFNDVGAQLAARSHTADDFLQGFTRFVRGLARKLLIADPSGRIADAVFALPPEAMPVHYAWIGAIAYTVQIYFDFCGYSDMAIGMARICGIRFPENFNQPYHARSITEFWQRWHISLSTWMRVYLYIPLGGNRLPEWRVYLNLWIVFLISGLWHGAAWTFILWGAYYGFFLTVERFAQHRGWRLPVPDFARQGITLLLVVMGWVLFRADSLDYAWRMLRRMYGLLPPMAAQAEPMPLFFPQHPLAMVVLGLLLAVVPWRSLLPGRLRFDIQPQHAAGSAAALLAHWGFHVALLVLSVAAMLAAGSSAFLYFRF